MDLIERLKEKDTPVAVIGLGYVGLPLAVELATAGYTVIGLDTNEEKIRSLGQGVSYVADVPSELISNLVRNERLVPTAEVSSLDHVCAVSICVPTPLSKSKDPDLRFVKSAIDDVMGHFHRGLLIVLESTTYPGTTDELVVQPIENMGYRAGADFFACFSPERVDPGNKRFNTANTPKVIGGHTPKCLEMGCAYYSSIAKQLVPVSSTRVAEMAKLLENTYRSVNIALVNEMSLMCEKMGVDVWEVIGAAETKPFGFTPFYPGPGIGGHCIPFDPLYLSWKARSHGYYDRFITLATEINAQMPMHVVSKVQEALNNQGLPVKNSRVLVLGIAYKPDIDDVRESPGLQVMARLVELGADVGYCDPYVSKVRLGAKELTSMPLSDRTFKWADCVVMITNHSAFDCQHIAQISKQIVDTRNAFEGCNGSILTLGKPRAAQG